MNLDEYWGDDRIDAEHEEAIASMMNDAMYHANDKDMADLGWYRALDADNQPIHADDEMFLKGDSVGRVTAIGVGQRSEWVWTLRDGRNVSIAHHACTLRHHKPTIEDVLEEFGSKMHGITTEERERLVNEAADEIRGLL